MKRVFRKTLFQVMLSATAMSLMLAMMSTTVRGNEKEHGKDKTVIEPLSTEEELDLLAEYAISPILEQAATHFKVYDQDYNLYYDVVEDGDALTDPNLIQLLRVSDFLIECGKDKVYLISKDVNELHLQ